MIGSSLYAWVKPLSSFGATVFVDTSTKKEHNVLNDFQLQGKLQGPVIHSYISLIANIAKYWSFTAKIHYFHIVLEWKVINLKSILGIFIINSIIDKVNSVR